MKQKHKGGGVALFITRPKNHNYIIEMSMKPDMKNTKSILMHKVVL